MNLFVVGGRSFSSTVTVCGHSPMVFFIFRIVYLLVPFAPKGHQVNSHIPKNKLSGGQQQEVFVAMKFTNQVSTFVELKLLWKR